MGKEIDIQRILVKRLIKGDKKAFRSLYDRYHNEIYAYSLSLLKSKPYAEEIVQDVFLKIWTKRKKLDVSLSFKSYLYTITRNMCFNFLKKAAHEIKLREQVFFQSQISKSPDNYHSKNIESDDFADGNIQEAEIEEIKQQAIGLLPPKRRQIFEMSRNEGKSYADISKELGISVSTVKSQMSKALETIRIFLLNNKEHVFPIQIKK